MLHLLKLRALEDNIVGHFLVECRFALRARGDDEFKPVAVRLRRHKIRPLAQPTCRDESTDLLRKYVLQSITPNRYAQLVEPTLPLRINRLTRRPSLDALNRKKTRLHPVDDIVQRIRRIVRPIHNLALNTFERVELFSTMQCRRNLGVAKNKVTVPLLPVVEKVLGR